MTKPPKGYIISAVNEFHLKGTETMTKTMKMIAENAKKYGTYTGTSGNGVWTHEWYTTRNGMLVRITYKNGKMVEAENLGR